MQYNGFWFGECFKEYSHFEIAGFDNPHHNNGNNGFGMDAALNNLNGMTNVPASVANNMMMGVPSLPSLTQPNNLPSADSISTSSGEYLLLHLIAASLLKSKILFGIFDLILCFRLYARPNNTTGWCYATIIDE